MKEHILRLLNYNNKSNRQLIEVTLQLPERKPALILISHLITAQDKWLNRVSQTTADTGHQWFGKVFSEEDILQEWTRSISAWCKFIETQTDELLDSDIYFTRQSDGKLMKVKLADIALQISYHNMHHRAQINKLISGQGITPPATDFILTAISEA